MVPLQVKAAGRAGAIALEGEAPGRAADAAVEIVEGRCRAGRHAPAGGGGTGFGGGGLAEEKAHDPVFASPERQPPAGGEVEPAGMAAEFGEDGREAGAAQPVLEDPEGLPRPAGTDDAEPPRIEAEMIEAGPVRCAGLADGRFLHHPENRPVVHGGKAGEKRGGEAGDGGSVAGGLSPQFVKGAAAQPAAEHVVDAGDAERQHRPAPARGEEGPRRSGGNGRKSGRIRIVLTAIIVHLGQAVIPDIESRRPAFDLGDPPAKPGKAFPCHRNACAHGDLDLRM